jgi:pimeloyl-ACP methyl ester carboxylesterase
MRSNYLLHSHQYGGLAVDELPGNDDRPPVVLLHGLTFDRTMWRPALRRLATVDPDRRAIAIDLPGHGESPDDDDYALDAVVGRIRGAVVDAAVTAPVLVGHSASAATVAVYAATYPTSGFIEVEGTFLVEPFAHLVQRLEPALRGDGFAAAWTQISAAAFRLDETSEDVRSFVRETSRPRQDVVLGYWRDLLERRPEDLAARIEAGVARIRALGLPLRSVVGQEPSPAEAAWIVDHLPDLQTLVWPGSGHFPQLAHPDKFAELLDSTSSWAMKPDLAAFVGA